MSKNSLVRWLQQLAGEIGGQAIVDGDRIVLRPASPKWETITGSKESIVISPSPENVDAWRLRLRYVEKAAAQAILAGPVGFFCDLIGTGNGKGEAEQTEVFRFAFGLSLSAGTSCYHRYTAYFIPDLDLSAYIEGVDKLFEDIGDIQALDLKEPRLPASVECLLNLAARIEKAYIELDHVTEQIETLNQSLSNELRALNRFYTPGRGQYSHVLGNIDPKLRGEDRLDAEYANKAQDVIEKYQVRVIFHPLSLGMIRCCAKVIEDAKGSKLTFPFIVKPILASKS